MCKLLFLSLFIIVMSCTNGSLRHPDKKEGLTAKMDTAQKTEMKQYWLVFLLKGPNRDQDRISSEKIQEAHMRNINRLAALGKIVIAGPMGYDKDLRGIFIMDCKDSLEAAGYINTDTAIVTGRMRFEIHPWWTAKGKVEFK